MNASLRALMMPDEIPPAIKPKRIWPKKKWVNRANLIWKSHFPFHVVLAMRALSKNGKIDQNNPSVYVLATFYERMEKLRASNTRYSVQTKELADKIDLLRKEKKQLEVDSSNQKKCDKMAESIDALTLKLSEIEDLQAKLGKSISQAGMDILAACKIRGAKADTAAPEPAEVVGSNSWNPDEPTPP